MLTVKHDIEAIYRHVDSFNSETSDKVTVASELSPKVAFLSGKADSIQAVS